MDEALEVPRRPMTGSQTRKFQDKLKGQQLAIEKCLVMKEELQSTLSSLTSIWRPNLKSKMRWNGAQNLPQNTENTAVQN